MNIQSIRIGALVSIAIVSLSTRAIAQIPHETDPVVNQVKQTVEQEKLVPDSQCIDYFLTRNIKPGVDLVDILEKHDVKCGGDPQTHPRLFSVYVDQKTHRMASDVNDTSGDGELKMLYPPK